MIELLDVLGPVAEAKLAGDRAVQQVVQFIRSASLGKDTAPHVPVDGSTLQDDQAASVAQALRRRRRRRMREGSALSSRSIKHMSDADLEKVLTERRRERERYARALRKDKLGRLEAELESLRRDIGKIESSAMASASSKHATRKSGSRGTPASADLYDDNPAQPKRGSLSVPSSSSLSRRVLGDDDGSAPEPPAPNLTDSSRSSLLPPPPPPAPPFAPMDFEEDPKSDDVANETEILPNRRLVVDPEKRNKEKEERQRRREEKRKEREASQKKLTLADIIRGAGPDPIRLLKPMTPKPTDLDQEEWERVKAEREKREAEQERDRIEKERLAKEMPGQSAPPAIVDDPLQADIAGPAGQNDHSEKLEVVETQKSSHPNGLCELDDVTPTAEASSKRVAEIHQRVDDPSVGNENSVSPDVAELIRR